MDTRTTPRQPGTTRESVETERGAPADWSHLAEDYARIGNLTALARLYHRRYDAVRAELVRQSIPIKPRGHVKGQRKSESWRQASEKHWNDPAWRAEQRRKWIERLPTLNGPATNSPLERKLLGALERAGIGYVHQRLLLDKYLVDILIRQAPVVIEADGALHVRNRERDEARDADLTRAGYRVFRFTGRRINASPDACIREVADAAGLVREDDPVYTTALVRRENHPSWRGGKQSYPCLRCGTPYEAYPRQRESARSKFCSRACQVEWQRESRASVTNRRSNADRMRALWADPQWRADQTERIRTRRWPQQAVSQSALTGDRES